MINSSININNTLTKIKRRGTLLPGNLFFKYDSPRT